MEFIKWSSETEIQLRGRVMQISCEIEYLLLNIILACLMDAPTEAVREYSHLTIEKKIVMFKKDLKKYYPKLFATHKDVLKGLLKVKKIRNRFAHAYIGWDLKKTDTSYFNILILSKQKGKGKWKGMEKPTLIKMTFEEFDAKITEMKKVLFDLVPILEGVQNEFNSKYPGFIPSIFP